LEKIEHMLLQLDFKLKDSITLDCFADLSAARFEARA